MIVDPTTQNHIYNPASPQGQWFQHRWGKRNYPTLNLPANIQFNSDIRLESFYGDPLTWPNINNFCEQYKNNIHILTYGMGVVHVYDNVSFTFKIDGMNELCGTLYLGADWNEITTNIETVKHCSTIEFALYPYNKHQVDDITTWCAERNIPLNITEGFYVDYYGTSVIDESGTWLYDVLKDDAELYRSVTAYNSLRTYVKGAQGRSILNKPMLPRLQHGEEFSPDGIYITPTGHKFENRTLFGMFMNMLCDDWKLPKERNDYQQHVLACAHQLANTSAEPVVTG